MGTDIWEDYALFGELEKAGCCFVLRLRQEAGFTAIEQEALSAEDRAAGVTFDGLVPRLGEYVQSRTPCVRLIRVQIERWGVVAGE